MGKNHQQGGRHHSQRPGGNHIRNNAICRIILSNVREVPMTDFDGLAERYYASADPQFQEDDEEKEINHRAADYVAQACFIALDELSPEERESLEQSPERLLDLIQSYI